jgi:hypothetical protein
MGGQAAGVNVFAVLLYIFPSAFLWAAWRREARAGFAEARPLWRDSLPQGCILCRSVQDSLEPDVSSLANGTSIYYAQHDGPWTTLTTKPVFEEPEHIRTESKDS